MEVMKAILSRRSIRKYKPDPIPDDLLRELLEAAMSAPSSDNRQPWHFVVIDDRSTLDGITRFHPISFMLKGAPLAIAICGDLHAAKGSEVWVQDCSAATENLLIAANACGLGAVWLGIYPTKARVCGLKGLLSLPQDIVPLALVAIGYPAEKKPRENRYNENKVHRNTW